MDDLSRLLVTFGVHRRTLEGGEDPEDAPRQARREEEHLAGGDEGVAPENGREPGDARVHEPVDSVQRACLGRHGEEEDVGHRLTEHRTEPLVRRLDRRMLHLPEPVLALADCLGAGEPVARRGRDLLAPTVDDDVDNPFLLGSKGELEHGPRPAPSHFRTRDRAAGRASDPIEPAVGEDEHVILHTRRLQAAAAGTAQPAQLEHVAEVGGEDELEAQRQRLEMEAVQHEADEHLRPAQQRRPPDGQGGPRGEEAAVSLGVVIGEIRDRAEVVAPDRPGEEEGGAAACQELELRQVARPAKHESELLVDGEGEIARLIEHGERVAVGQDVLATSAGERGGEHVVLVAHPQVLALLSGRRERCSGHVRDPMPQRPPSRNPERSRRPSRPRAPRRKLVFQNGGAPAASASCPAPAPMP